MRRNTNDWIARIFAVVTAGTPLLSGCDQTVPVANADLQRTPSDIKAAIDMAPPADMAPPEDLTVAFDFAYEMGPTIRRPFLVGRSLRAAAIASRGDWLDRFEPARDVDAATSRALAAAWLKDALEEHASVAAFARFSVMGLAVGAPPAIIAASQRASLDEIHHARTCFGLAQRYGAGQVGPAALSLEGAFGATTLSELVALTAEEGCVGETLGALLAQEQARVATDPPVKRALKRIARDEQRHAELAWQFLAWACEVGGTHVVDRAGKSIGSAVAHTRASVLKPLEVDAPLWHAHGRLSCEEARQVAERGIVEIVLPAFEQLARRNFADADAAYA